MEPGSQVVPSTHAAEGGHRPYQGSVLRIIVENLHYPVTIEVLYQVMRLVKNKKKTNLKSVPLLLF